MEFFLLLEERNIEYEREKKMGVKIKTEEI